MKGSEQFHTTKRRCRTEPVAPSSVCVQSFPVGERPPLFSLGIGMKAHGMLVGNGLGFPDFGCVLYAKWILVQTVTMRQGRLQMEFSSYGAHAQQPSLPRKCSKVEKKAILSFEEHRGLGCRGAGNVPEVTEQKSKQHAGHEPGEWSGWRL